MFEDRDIVIKGATSRKEADYALQALRAFAVDDNLRDRIGVRAGVAYSKENSKLSYYVYRTKITLTVRVLCGHLGRERE